VDLAAPAPITADRSERMTTFRWAAAFLLASMLFLASDVALHPIVLWDESRLAVNALEMSQRGFSLVTTYGSQPDLWNTKPPLLIWLEAASIRAFGPAEWALRLPSLLAAVATVAMVMRFSWRLGGSRFVMLAAPFMLVLSPGYFGGHAAQSGDYETLLCLFTTAYLFLLFELVHRERPDPWRVLACGLLIAAACLTKGVAGLVPGAGAFAYVLVRGRLPRLFKTPWYALAGLVVVILVGGFYALRERAAPGYLTAVMHNELGGRYLHGMQGHIQPPYYYLQMVFQLFAFGPALALLLVGMVLRWKPTKSAAFFTYANFVSVGLLVVYSASRTKIFWYIVPIYPFVSIALAIVFERILRMLPHRPARRLQVAHLLIAVAALYMLVTAFVYRFSLAPRLEDNPQGRYGQVFAQLDAEGVRRIRTLDGGVANDDNLVDYTPQRLFYSLVWRARGLDIDADDPNAPPTLTEGAALVTCDARYLAQVRSLGRPLTSVADCAAVAGPSRGG
jgi:4-amino-4-deoxy-L-arabinose transferase-like glycosyltransferase